MGFIRLLPVVLCSLLLGAHFLRTGLMLPAALVLLLPAVLLIRRPWTARLVQFVLVLGTIEWLRALLFHVAERRAMGQPWSRLALIIGSVAVFTGGAAALFSFSRSIRKRYSLNSPIEEESRPDEG